MAASASPNITKKQLAKRGRPHMESKFGPILWQLAPTKKFDRDDIAAFLELLAEKFEGLKLRHALEK